MLSVPRLRRLSLLSLLAALSFSLVEAVPPAVAVEGEVFQDKGTNKVKNKVKNKNKNKDSTTTTSSTTSTSTSTTTTTLPQGIITTYAGNGVAGYSGDGRPATSASLAMDAGFTYCIRGECAVPDNILRITGLTLGADGSLLIADVKNNRVRKVAPTGEITTVAGTGVSGYGGDGGPATAALLAHPRGLALDGAGNLYVADAQNHVIRRVDTAGVIGTVAGNGVMGTSSNYVEGRPATETPLCYPQGVTVDGSSNLYIADSCTGSVRKVDSSGVMTTIVGGPTAVYFPEQGDGKQGREVRLRGPGALALDGNGNLYIGSNSGLWKLETSGTLRLLGEDIWAAGLAVDGAGDLYFSAIFKYIVAKMDASTGAVSVVAGRSDVSGSSGDGGPATEATLRSPSGLALGSGTLFIADPGDQRVRVVR